ncbi:MAG: Mut7-C RNAse domain-containing protein [Leptolyngbyaceae cyanobacterium]
MPCSDGLFFWVQKGDRISVYPPFTCLDITTVSHVQPPPLSQVADQIPYYTRLTYDEFAQCQSCEQIYWKGAHYGRIQALIERVSVATE